MRTQTIAARKIKLPPPEGENRNPVEDAEAAEGAGGESREELVATALISWTLETVGETEGETREDKVDEAAGDVEGARLGGTTLPESETVHPLGRPG